MDETIEQKVQRGKRRTARYTEIVLVVLVAATLWGVDNAFETLQIVLIPGLTYSAALRSVDAHYK